MVNKGQMALIQVSEILSFTQICIYDYVYIYRILYTVYTHMFVCVPPLKLAVFSRYLRIKAGIDILVDVFFARLYYLKIKLRS